MVIRYTPLVSVFCMVMAGCTTGGSAWNGRVEQWGAMRTVLREGRTEGRVDLDDFAGRPHIYGVGALAQLAGEVTIIDGRVCLARPKGTDGIRVDEEFAQDQQAALLTVAHVSAWRGFPVEQPMSTDRLEGFLRDAARQAGIDTDRPFPVLITGPVGSIEGHVINGRCPMRPADTANAVGGPPARIVLLDDEATIVGFFAENEVGTITHHGSVTHLHFVREGEPTLSGHVDNVTLKAESVVHLPAR